MTSEEPEIKDLISDLIRLQTPSFLTMILEEIDKDFCEGLISQEDALALATEAEEIDRVQQ